MTSRLLANVPIRQKLVIIAMLSTGLALLLAGIVLIFFERARFKRDMTREMVALAEITGRNSTASLTFGDEDAARDTLAALGTRQTIAAAALYEADGAPLATYKRDPEAADPPSRPEPVGHRFGDGAFFMTRAVKLSGKAVGTVYLRSDLSEMNERLRIQAATIGAVFLVSGLTALLLSSWLQRVISGPILHLSQTAREVSERKDFSIRAARQGQDELGQLVDAFNDMLTQIQDRDSRLQKAREGLEQRVRERTQELRQELAERQRAENELARSNEELYQSNKELDDFAYIASHDLKEPLRGIHNYSTFLLEDYADKLDDDGRAKLETLTRLTRRMETLIDSLLHFSRLGRVDLAIDEVNLNEIVGEVVDSLGISLKSDRIDLRVPRPLPTVRADRARVGEIFHNLILNAMKYNDKAEKWIEIGSLDQPGDRPPVFYIRDNGIGIQEKHFDSVFRIFKRLHAREKYGGGTGAGLTIVKKIVERHNGRIWVESTYGEGTTFYFTLSDKGDTRA